MNPEQVWDDFNSLPSDAKQQAADFIAFLKQRASSTRRSKAVKHPGLVDDPFIGMWRDRDEMRDSTAWVRETRKREWTR